MAKNNSSNQDYTNNADGWDLSGGTTKRKLTVTGADMTLTGSGTNVYTMPAATDTLVGRASTDTLTNKTLTTPVVDQFNTSSGLGSAWPSWTPTLTNLTLGNGTITAKYIQIGKTVHFHIVFTLGSTSAVGSNPNITLPVTRASYANTSSGYPGIGHAHFEDNGVAAYEGVVDTPTTTTIRPLLYNVASTYATIAAITSTVPFTWGTGDEIIMTGTYEAA